MELSSWGLDPYFSGAESTVSSVAASLPVKWWWWWGGIMFFFNCKTILSPAASLIIKIIGDVLANKHLYRIFFMLFFLFLNPPPKKTFRSHCCCLTGMLEHQMITGEETLRHKLLFSWRIFLPLGRKQIFIVPLWAQINVFTVSSRVSDTKISPRMPN